MNLYKKGLMNKSSSEENPKKKHYSKTAFYFLYVGHAKSGIHVTSTELPKDGA